MNVEVRDRAPPAQAQAEPPRHRRLRPAPRSAFARRPAAVPVVAHPAPHRHLRHGAPHRLAERRAGLSQVRAVRRAARCVPAERRPARQRSRVHPPPAPRSVQRAARADQPAAAIAELHERQPRQRDEPRLQRVADRGAGAARASTARLDRGELRGPASRGRRDRALCRHRGLRPRAADEPYHGTARRAPLCADPRRCGRGRTSRWRCTRSASAAIPPRHPAGRRSISRTWSATRRGFRRTSPAW